MRARISVILISTVCFLFSVSCFDIFTGKKNIAIKSKDTDNVGRNSTGNDERDDGDKRSTFAPSINTVIKVIAKGNFKNTFSLSFTADEGDSFVLEQEVNGQYEKIYDFLSSSTSSYQFVKDLDLLEEYGILPLTSPRKYRVCAHRESTDENFCSEEKTICLAPFALKGDVCAIEPNLTGLALTSPQKGQLYLSWQAAAGLPFTVKTGTSQANMSNVSLSDVLKKSYVWTAPEDQNIKQYFSVCIGLSQVGLVDVCSNPVGKCIYPFANVANSDECIRSDCAEDEDPIGKDCKDKVLPPAIPVVETIGSMVSDNGTADVKMTWISGADIKYFIKDDSTPAQIFEVPGGVSEWTNSFALEDAGQYGTKTLQLCARKFDNYNMLMEACAVPMIVCLAPNAFSLSRASCVSSGTGMDPTSCFEAGGKYENNNCISKIPPPPKPDVTFRSEQTSNTKSTITLYWNAIPDDRYVVQVSQGGSFTTLATINTPTSIQVTYSVADLDWNDLSGSAPKQYQVCAIRKDAINNDMDPQCSDPVVICMDPTQCGAKFNGCLAPFSISTDKHSCFLDVSIDLAAPRPTSNNAVDLSWDVSDSMQGLSYTVKYDTEPNGGFLSKLPTTSLSATSFGIAASQDHTKPYYFKVCASFNNFNLSSQACSSALSACVLPYTLKTTTNPKSCVNTCSTIFDSSKGYLVDCNFNSYNIVFPSRPTISSTVLTQLDQESSKFDLTWTNQNDADSYMIIENFGSSNASAPMPLSTNTWSKIYPIDSNIHLFKLCALSGSDAGGNVVQACTTINSCLDPFTLSGNQGSQICKLPAPVMTFSSSGDRNLSISWAKKFGFSFDLQESSGTASSSAHYNLFESASNSYLLDGVPESTTPRFFTLCSTFASFSGSTKPKACSATVMQCIPPSIQVANQCLPKSAFPTCSADQDTVLVGTTPTCADKMASPIVTGVTSSVDSTGTKAVVSFAVSNPSSYISSYIVKRNGNVLATSNLTPAHLSFSESLSLPTGPGSAQALMNYEVCSNRITALSSKPIAPICTAAQVCLAPFNLKEDKSGCELLPPADGPKIIFATTSPYTKSTITWTAKSWFKYDVKLGTQLANIAAPSALANLDTGSVVYDMQTTDLNVRYKSLCRKYGSESVTACTAPEPFCIVPYNLSSTNNVSSCVLPSNCQTATITGGCSSGGCASGQININGQCYPACPTGQAFDQTTKTCKPITCSATQALVGSSCVDDCSKIDGLKWHMANSIQTKFCECSNAGMQLTGREICSPISDIYRISSPSATPGTKTFCSLSQATFTAASSITGLCSLYNSSGMQISFSPTGEASPTCRVACIDVPNPTILSSLTSTAKVIKGSVPTSEAYIVNPSGRSVVPPPGICFLSDIKFGNTTGTVTADCKVTGSSVTSAGPASCNVSCFVAANPPTIKELTTTTPVADNGRTFCGLIEVGIGNQTAGNRPGCAISKGNGQWALSAQLGAICKAKCVEFESFYIEL